MATDVEPWLHVLDASCAHGHDGGVDAVCRARVHVARRPDGRAREPLCVRRLVGPARSQHGTQSVSTRPATSQDTVGTQPARKTVQGRRGRHGCQTLSQHVFGTRPARSDAGNAFGRELMGRRGYWHWPHFARRLALKHLVALEQLVEERVLDMHRFRRRVKRDELRRCQAPPRPPPPQQQRSRAWPRPRPRPQSPRRWFVTARCAILMSAEGNTPRPTATTYKKNFVLRRSAK